MNWCLKPVVEAAACSIQNRFVANRQLLQNAVDLDFYSRRESLRYQEAMDDGNLSFLDSLDTLSFSHKGLINNMPVMTLLDYAMAFPSVSHAWVL